MTTLEKYENENTLEEQDFDKVSKLMFQSFLIKRNYKSHNFLDKKEELISYFTEFLEKYLELQFLNSKKDKLSLIDFIDKMNMQKELVELKKNETTLEEIEIAGKSLGRKSQSAFKKK